MLQQVERDSGTRDMLFSRGYHLHLTMSTEHFFIVDVYVLYICNRSWKYWKFSKSVLTAKVISKSLVDSSLLRMQIAGAVLTVDTCGLCCPKPPWQPFCCHSDTKAWLQGSEKASFPRPIINWDQLLFKGYDKWQNGLSFSRFWPYPYITQPELSSLLILHRTSTERVAYRQTFCPCEFSIVSEPSPESSFILQRREVSWVLRVYSFITVKRVRGGGGGWRGSGSGGFYVRIQSWIESSCLGNKTSKKKKSHFCMHLQMAGRAFVLC